MEQPNKLPLNSNIPFALVQVTDDSSEMIVKQMEQVISFLGSGVVHAGFSSVAMFCFPWAKGNEGVVRRDAFLVAISAALGNKFRAVVGIAPGRYGVLSLHQAWFGVACPNVSRYLAALLQAPYGTVVKVE